jgi:predicted Zn-dependent protease
MQEVAVSEGNGEKKQMKKDEKWEVMETPILVEKPGYVSVLVIPYNKSPTSSQMALKEINPSEASPYVLKASNKILDEVMNEVLIAQNLLSKKDAKSALETVEKIMAKYPQLSYLKFIKASCLMVMGNKDNALKVLEETLNEYPENKLALDLYSKLLPEGTKNRFIKQ